MRETPKTRLSSVALRGRERLVSREPRALAPIEAVSVERPDVLITIGGQQRRVVISLPRLKCLEKPL